MNAEFRKATWAHDRVAPPASVVVEAAFEEGLDTAWLGRCRSKKTGAV